MAGLDKLQVLTFLFGITVIVTTILTYQATSYDGKLQNLVDILTNGLAFFFVAYSALVISDKKSESLMYKYLLIVVALTAWAVWIFAGKRSTIDFAALVSGGEVNSAVTVPTDDGATGGWDAVAANIARPLALGSLFMWPYLWFHWSR